MNKVWNESAIQKYIDDEIQESLILDYKAADALGKGDLKKKEITKDVSSFANSAGGTIIFGVKEYDEPNKKHLPEKINVVDQTQFSKEWLEQVINNIRPRIDGLIIHPVSIGTGPNDVVYAVEIPQSTTAHQANDYRYYKRFNFQSVPMEDYEVRDVMGRSQHPQIDLEFEIELVTQDYRVGISDKVSTKTEFHLKIRARNSGLIYAQYVNGFVRIPVQILHKDELEYRDVFEKNGQQYCECYGDNTIRDVVDVEGSPPYTYKKYGPSRFEPILPSLSHELISIQLNNGFPQLELAGIKLEWSVHADNAQPINEKTLVSDIKVVDKR